MLDTSAGDWWKISYNGRQGWAYSRYLNPDMELQEQKETLPFEPEENKMAEVKNMLQLMKASINALYDELDRLEEMVAKL